MNLFATGHGRHVSVKSAKYSANRSSNLHELRPGSRGPLNNGGRVRIVSGDPLVRFELLSLLLNANLEYELTFFAPSGR